MRLQFYVVLHVGGEGREQKGGRSAGKNICTRTPPFSVLRGAAALNPTTATQGRSASPVSREPPRDPHPSAPAQIYIPIVTVLSNIDAPGSPFPSTVIFCDNDARASEIGARTQCEAPSMRLTLRSSGTNRFGGSARLVSKWTSLRPTVAHDVQFQFKTQTSDWFHSLSF